MRSTIREERDLLADECHKLRARVDYLESAIKLGGAAYRAARVGLGAPAVEVDDYLALKERAERAEQALADEWDAHKKTRERAEIAEAAAVQDRNELVKERVAHEGTKYMLDCERHEHDLTKAARDRLRNEPHIIEAGQTRYDAELWRARCLDAEERLAALRAIADYHADRGGTDLGRALAKVGER